MIRFTIYEDSVILDPYMLLVPEITAITDYGKEIDNPDRALEMLKFVFLCSELSDMNPINKTSHKDRPKEAKSMCRGIQKVTKVESELLSKCIDAYVRYNEDSPDRSREEIENKIDELRELLGRTKPEMNPVHDLDGQILKYATNYDKIDGISKTIKNLMEILEAITNTARRLQNTGKVKGDRATSMLESGRLGVKPDILDE